MLRDTKMSNFTKQATGLVGCKSWGYINSDFNEKDWDLADSSQILRLCHLLGVCASCHLWSRTSRGWGDQVTVLNKPRCDSDVVWAGCRKNENIEGLDTHTAISFQIDPLDWPLTVWYLRFCQFKKENLFKNGLQIREKCRKKRTWTFTWTMSLSAYLPLEEILTSSPSNSIIAEENINEIKLFTAETTSWP